MHGSFRTAAFSLPLFLLAACGSGASSAASILPPNPTSALALETTAGIPENALLFRQDFESGPPEAGSDEYTDWEVSPEDDGNHIYCLRNSDQSQVVYFGRDGWTDYAVEMRVKAVELGQDSYVALSARFDPFDYLGYYGAIGFQGQPANLAYNDPYRLFGQVYRRIELDTWYTMRIELAGERISYLLDDALVAAGLDTQRSHGKANISVPAGLKVCIDDVRAWALTPAGRIGQAPTAGAMPASNLEVVDIHPEIWSFNSPDGQSYEYKINCGSDYPVLDACVLWDLDQVVVTNPSGQVFRLEKDFNVNDYSGEVTRRWVLYGPQAAGLPESGTYTFALMRADETVLVRTVTYPQVVVPIATEVRVHQSGNELRVTWQPPEGITPDMDYKVIVFEANTWNLAASLSFPGDSREAILPDPPLMPGKRYELNVMLAGNHGYSASEHIFFTWMAP